MSTQRLELLAPIAKPDLLELKDSHFETIAYCFTRVFGCWHLRMSRPFTHGKETYRECLKCGMHRQFDVDGWKSTGRFYAQSIERRSTR